MGYMIERRYGRGNRDWLYAYGKSDQSTCWVCGATRAEVYSNITTARLMLERVRNSAASWENRESFEFVIVEDRRHLPTYFASTAIE
jgi:hypothetical protein